MLKLFAGDEPTPPKKRTAFGEMWADCVKPANLEEFSMDIALADGFSVSKMCGSLKGYLNKETNVRWMWAAASFGLTITPPGITAEFEVAAEIGLESNDDSGDIRWMETQARVMVGITVSSLDLELAAMVKLKGANQVWIRPFGTMMNMGLVFPFAIGIGLSIKFTVPPVVIPTYFEMEFGIMGCSSYVEEKPGMEKTLAELKNGSVVNLTDPLVIASELYQCGADDFYGAHREPTVMKIAMIYKKMLPEAPLIAFRIYLKEFSIGRLLTIFGDGPPNGFMKTIMPLLDLFYVEKLDVSFNSKPYPVTLYSGTVIDAGVTLDIENMDFFKILQIKKTYFRFQPKPLLVEAQLFIDPFEFKLGGKVILSVSGLDGPSRAESQAAKAKADRERLEREAELKKKLLAGESLANPCENKLCTTCADVKQDEKLKLRCTSKDAIMANIVFARWGPDDASLPAWTPNLLPDKCDPTVTPLNDTGWSTVPAEETAQELKSCIMKNECEISASQVNLGVALGAAGETTASPHRLRVAVECAPIALAGALVAKMEQDKINNLKCTGTEGCLTCAQAVESSKEDMDLELDCHEEGVIVEVVDAAYGVADEQPEWGFAEESATCTKTNIPKGSM
jgi:hypothetical protein